MTKLNELIQQFCPDGVEYKTLGSFATISRGGNFQKKDFRDDGFPCIHYGQIYTKYGLFVDKTVSFISPACASKQKTASKNDIIMAVTSENIEDVCKCIVWLGDGEVAVSGHSAIIRHSQNPKYLAYYFHSRMFFDQKRKLAHGTKVIEVTPDKLASVKIPLPPIEVQREIVRILDNFTELTAELTARKKQYEYYRDKLLAYNYDVELFTISDIAETSIGLATSVSQHKRENGVILLHNSDIQQNKIVLKTVEYISKEFAQKNKKKVLRKGDIITVHTGDVGTSAVIDDEYDGAIGFTTITTRIKDTARVNPYFLCHYLNSHKCKQDIASMTISDRSNLNQKSFNTIQIPVPPLEIQNRIVNVLDNFDAICSDLKIGLPAEIAARQKQYEFYRDKLLTFKEQKSK